MKLLPSIPVKVAAVMDLEEDLSHHAFATVVSTYGSRPLWEDPPKAYLSLARDTKQLLVYREGSVEGGWDLAPSGPLEAVEVKFNLLSFPFVKH